MKSKCYSRFISLFLTAAILLSFFPIFQMNSIAYSTPKEVSVGTIATRANELVALLGGEGAFFTTTRKGCKSEYSNNHGCYNCTNANVIKQNWFKSIFGSISVNQFPEQYYPNNGLGYRTGASCHGFAAFAMWFLFKQNNTDRIDGKKIGEFSLTKSNFDSYIWPGDLLRTTGHSMIVINWDSNGYYVLDCNAIGDLNCEVHIYKRDYQKNRAAVTRATNAADISTNEINKSNSKITAKRVRVPENIAFVGNKFDFSGTISSNAGFTYAGAMIYSAKSGMLLQSGKKSFQPSSQLNRFVLLPTNIDADEVFTPMINFSKLSAGRYKLKLFVLCKHNRFESIQDLLDSGLLIYDDYFTVGSGSSAKKSKALLINSSENRDRYGNTYKILDRVYYDNSINNSNSSTSFTENNYSGNTYYNASSSYSLGSYTVTARSGLNTRQSPSATSRKLSGLKYGATVTVTATDGNWGYVDGYGWICLDYTSYNGGVTSSYNQKVYYETGNYAVSYSSGLNCRKGPGTGYAIKRTLPNGTMFSVTETSGAWGYSPEFDGWLCLSYARYVSALTPALPVPDGPAVTTNSSSEIAVGDIITVNWNPIEYADHYTAQLIDATNGSVVETKDNLTSYTAAFATPYAGKFNVTVIAGNSQHTGATGGVYGIEAKNPSTVTFKDWDGKVLSTQKVAYGKNATAPATPTRTGYTFKEWSDSFNTIRTNKTITAVYTRNSYTVRFLDHDGAIVDTQSVLYTDAATEPEYTAPSGYSFVKWDKNFSSITENTDVTAVVSWTSQYPLEIQATSNVVRNNTTYISTAIVNNSPNAVSNAKLILALKTAENKQLAYVESDIFSMAAGERKTVNLSVDYDGASTVGNLFVVQDNNERIPKSNQLVVTVDQGTAWSQWSTSTPPANALQTQSRPEYRYRDKVYETANSSTLNGYTLRTDVTNPTYGDWGPWSSWQDTAVSSNNLRQVETQTVYMYYHYGVLKNDGTRSCVPLTWQEYNQASNWNHPGVSHDYHEITLTYTLNPASVYTYFGNDYQGYTGYDCSCVNNGSGSLKDDYWFYKGSKTQYRYRTRTATYYFEKWGSWSNWGTTKYTSSNTRDVQTRTAYRYVSNIPANIEDTTGLNRTITGSVGSGYANKHAILSITSLDGTTQFIGQTKLDASGNYSFSFKLKDDPSVESGDYNVTLSIENTNAAIELDPILAPVPTYTVTFKDWDGAILSTQNVTKGESADIPDAPEHEGYKFVKWNKSATNVTEDMTVTAVYAVKSFGVVFLDDLNETSEIRMFNYGDALEVPDVTAPEGYTFLGWDAVINGITTVTENMVVNAVFEKNTYTVTYLDHNDNVIDTVTVEYGDAPIAPATDDSDSITVYGWNPDGDTVYVTGDTTVRTAFDYNEYVETPSVNVETGTYMTAQTVTIDCPTDGATIYYTLDGTDPLSYLSDTQTGDSASYAPAKRSPAKAPSVPDAEPHIYNGPFTLNSSAKLVVAAVKDEMGDSGREESILAINTPSTEIKKHLVTLHLGLDQYETSFLVEDGAKIPNDEWYKSYFGYTLNGTFFDASKTAPVDLDSFVVTQSVDVYYDWTPTVYTVTFLASDGKELDSQQVEYLQDASAPAWPEIDGKTFSGWDNVYTNVSSDLIVKATYIDNTDLTTVSFDKSELTIKEGATESIVATVSLGGGSDNSQVFWESSNEEVVMVDDNGTVQAIKKGTATIYAVSEDSGMSAACEVTVESADPCDEGHSYGAWTRLDDNQHQRICTNNPAHVEKANHSWNAGVITTEAKCETNGIKTFTCTVCNATKTESIKALGHTSPNGHGNCDRCGKHLKDVDPGNNRPAGACKYCGQVHGGAFGWLIKFFHGILAMFGLRK